MTDFNRKEAIKLARRILANVRDDFNEDELNDIGTRAVYWVTRLGTEIYLAPPSGFKVFGR